MKNKKALKKNAKSATAEALKLGYCEVSQRVANNAHIVGIYKPKNFIGKTIKITISASGLCHAKRDLMKEHHRYNSQRG